MHTNLFAAKDIGHGDSRKVPTKGVCLGETPDSLSEPVDVRAHDRLHSQTCLALLDYMAAV